MKISYPLDTGEQFLKSIIVECRAGSISGLGFEQLSENLLQKLLVTIWVKYLYRV